MVEDKRIVRALDVGCSFKTEADKEKFLRACERQSKDAFWFFMMFMLVIMIAMVGFGVLGYYGGYFDGVGDAAMACSALAEALA